MSNVTRHPAGSPVGGRFAPAQRPAAAVQLEVSGAPGDAEARAHAVARHAGWPLLADTLVEMADSGDIPASALDQLDDDMAVAMGEDHIGPTIDTVEEALLSDWQDHEDDSTEVAGDELDEPVELDMEALIERCRRAGVPDHVAGFVEAAYDRGGVPADYLNLLDEFDLSDLHIDHVEPGREGIAADLSATRAAG